ncbi:glycoside hydrolase family 113 [Paenibacillus glufosinatiresistens]|uniref:glycoside hydrolase family 113 n=1 Tax=Paenibacillus glufosinatiresistens TaxID=3070657 RepID=UPI00286E3B70|nr:1,4-beta-xylanase [Paenibacillus sp. YX.27]
MTWPSAYIAGVTWGAMGRRGTWGNESALESMRLMKEETGATWIAIAFGALQDTAHTTEIRFREAPTVTDEEIEWAISSARSLGLQVCLKPIVNCADGTWRAHINFFDKDVPCEPKWSEWFASYTAFMLHYAELAERTGCDLLCIGCETVQADRRAEEWRALIAEIRKVYSGTITYNCDKYQEDNVTWWDAVDVISSSGYYPEHDWEEQLDRIQAVVEREGKPFFFMEAGCPSRSGSAAIPNDWTLNGQPNEAEQARYYRAMFEACRPKKWIHGFMLWDWPARLYDRQHAADNRDYCMYGKEAAGVVKDFYTAQTSI